MGNILPHSPLRYAATRHDGWTIARQAHFLRCLGRQGSVSAACAAVGMSCASAYRLRRRADAATFAAAWDACLLPHFAFRQPVRRPHPPLRGTGVEAVKGVEGVEGQDFAARRQFHQHRPASAEQRQAWADTINRASNPQSGVTNNVKSSPSS